MAAPLSAFAAAVRAHDWPRHIAIQFAPEDKRSALTALFAFNAEIDRITKIASDPLPGEIRLQWWREVLSGDREGEAAGHPLSAALGDAMRQHRLPLPALDRFLEAKAFALYHDAFPDRTSFEAWCGETEGALQQLAALVLDPEASANASGASGHGGIVHAVSNILCELPRTRAKGQCWIPADILAACGLSRESYDAGIETEAVANAVLALSEFGQKHLQLFSKEVKRLPKSLQPAYLPIHAARHVLDRAAAKPGAVPTHGVPVSNLRKFLSVARVAIF